MALLLGVSKPVDAGSLPWMSPTIQKQRMGSHDKFIVKPNPYGALPNPFTVKPNPYGAWPNPFTAKPNPYGGCPNPFTANPTPS